MEKFNEVRTDKKDVVIGNDIVSMDDFLKTLEKLTKIKYKLGFDFNYEVDPTSYVFPRYAHQEVLKTKYDLLETAEKYERTVRYKMSIVPDEKTVEDKKGQTVFKKRKKFKYNQVKHDFCMSADLLDRSIDGHTRLIDHVTGFHVVDTGRERADLGFDMDKDMTEVLPIMLNIDQFKNCDPVYIQALNECYKEKAAAAHKEKEAQEIEME